MVLAPDVKVFEIIPCEGFFDSLVGRFKSGKNE